MTSPDPVAAPAAARALEADAGPGPAPPIVSVIVRTCNRRRSLEECLQSLQAQTWQDFEVILVNDGGEDVADLVEEMSPPLQVTYRAWRPSRGRPQALNAGLKEARGECIAYLDDDDIYYPDHLETLVTALSSGNYRVAYADIAWAFQRLTPDGTYETYERRQLHARAFDPDWLLFENYIPNNAMMHARACLEAVGPFDEAFEVLEDWELWIRLAQQYEFHHVGKCTAEYRKRDDGSNVTDDPSHRELFVAATAQLFTKYTHDRERAAQRLFERLKQQLGERDERIARLEVGLASQAASLDHDRQGAEALQREREAATQQVQALTGELEQERRRLRAIEHDLEEECRQVEALQRQRDEVSLQVEIAKREREILCRERDELQVQLARIQNTILYRLLDVDVKDLRGAIRRFARKG